MAPALPQLRTLVSTPRTFVRSRDHLGRRDLRHGWGADRQRGAPSAGVARATGRAGRRARASRALATDHRPPQRGGHPAAPRASHERRGGATPGAAQARPLPGADRRSDSRRCPGCPTFLARWRAGGPARRRHLRLALGRRAPPRRSGLLRYFDVVVTSDDVMLGKPDPEVWTQAARRLRAAPTTCVVFEDALVGVQAARAAGMRVIGVTTALYRGGDGRGRRRSLRPFRLPGTRGTRRSLARPRPR